MTRHKRRPHLSPLQKTEFRTTAERFHRTLAPMFRDLVPAGDEYRALRAVSDAINAAYRILEIDLPDRLRTGPLRTMDGHKQGAGE